MLYRIFICLAFVFSTFSQDVYETLVEANLLGDFSEEKKDKFGDGPLKT